MARMIKRPKTKAWRPGASMSEMRERGEWRTEEIREAAKLRRKSKGAPTGKPPTTTSSRKLKSGKLSEYSQQEVNKLAMKTGLERKRKKLRKQISHDETVIGMIGKKVKKGETSPRSTGKPSEISERLKKNKLKLSEINTELKNLKGRDRDSVNLLDPKREKIWKDLADRLKKQRMDRWKGTEEDTTEISKAKKRSLRRKKKESIEQYERSTKKQRGP